MSDSKTSAYIETDSLQEWNRRMNKINTEATKLLDSYLKTVSDLKEHMLGNVATGFVNDTSSIVENAQTGHKEMEDAENFLLEVVKLMSEQ